MLRIALGQVETRVGDIDGNMAEILDAWHRAAEQGADLIVFTELAVTGYPPEDLLLKPEFVEANLRAVDRLAAEGPPGTVAVVGHVGSRNRHKDLGEDPTARDHWDVALAARDLTNAASVIADGQVVAIYNKERLPNYGVFDEARYFVPDSDTCVVRVAGVPVGVVVCEDLWTEEGPVRAAHEAGARVIASVHASPYHRGKRTDRERWVTHHAGRGLWVAYVNVVGGQDEVVFDGDSMLCAPDGQIVVRGAQFETDLVVFDLDVDPTADCNARADLPGHAGERPALLPWTSQPRLDPVAEVYAALVRATRDYCHRNGFREAVLGLSGGIDSSLAAAIVIDALGPRNVTGVAMPSPYSSQHSLDDAQALAKAFGCHYRVLPIEGPLEALSETLDGLVVTGFGHADADRQPGVAYENLQARIRGLLLMALSNEHGSILITTGNKSEYAVGYATLYGDMAGGFAPLKDVSKLLVYELARWRNRDGEMIPTSTIDKPPSAELRPDQRDQDSLPPYEVLDDIIAAYVEDDLGVAEIVARGHDEATVQRMLHLIDRAEFKRRQAAPGPKITERAFGRDRRVPITNQWRG